MNRIDDLASLLGVERQAWHGFNWPAIERSLGLELPAEYKEIAETFPRGEFQGAVKLIRPGDVDGDEDDYLGYFAHRLQDMREWRNDDPGRFPFPIYPEEGGLLPWGWTSRSALLFWRTTGSWDKWTVVVADPTFEKWVELDQGLCDFLIELVTGRVEAVDVHDLGVAGGRPTFVYEKPLPATSQSSGMDFWERMRGPGGAPESNIPALESLLPSEVLRAQSPVNWTRAQENIGIWFPADYREFMETFGPGNFIDLKIMAPDISSGDLAAFLAKKSEDARKWRRKGGRPPVYPEKGGLIAWGETSDGWTCGWAPVGHPDTWGVVLVSPRFRSVDYLPELSFSAFLVAYADPEKSLFLGRDQPNRTLPLFQPCFE
ncbi:hypothetical protein [Amycolatopsis sp. ATCC 39116]|uniref:hypothetical protein n=1 Tax=Amycolatopsis sp. (strain ATCC 39116 / 75iv2) TaxID=385957 RepID=UPI0012FCC53B|nr:hypothetical protein [Amycolatopsis sp. ATCC 39116]